MKHLKIVVKADVQGSAEAVRDALLRLTVQDTKAEIIRTGVGQINETDVMLASASEAIVVGFNVGSTGGAHKLAEQEGVEIRLYEVIYKLTEDIELALIGMLEPKIVEVLLGELEIRAIFRTDRSAVVVGGMVLTGKIQRGASYRLKRGDKVIFEGQLGSLRRFKEDSREVSAGYECGLQIDGTSDVQEGDTMQFFVLEKHAAIEAMAPSTTASTS